MGGAQMDKKMGKRVKIEDKANGGVMYKDGRTYGTKTKLGFMALMALMFIMLLGYPMAADAETMQLDPNLAGSSSSWLWELDGSGGGDYTNWLSDDGAASTADDANSKNTNQTVNVTGSGGQTGEINSVTVYATCNGFVGGTDPPKIALVMIANSTTGTGTTQTLSESFDTYQATWTQMPDGVSWGSRWQHIDSLEIGVRSTENKSDAKDCTRVYAVVDYSPLIDNLSVSSNEAFATSATGGDTGIKMQRMALDCDNSGDGVCVISSVTVNDMGTAEDGDWANMYIHFDDDTDFDNGTLSTNTTVDWSGASTNIDITDETVSFGTTKYMWIIYDLNQTAGGKAVQSRVTDIYVAGTDNGTANAWGSYSFPIELARDTLSNVANTPVAGDGTVTEGDTGVKMMYLPVNCSTGQDEDCLMTTITVDDIGTAGSGDWTNMHVHVDDDANFDNGTLTTKTTANWDGTSTVVDITDHTVSFGTEKYIHIIYDMASTSGGKDIRASITDITVAEPDTEIADMTEYSNNINILHIDDTLTMSSGIPVVLSATAGDTALQMQRFAVNCNNNADGACEMTTVTVEDTGTAEDGDWANMYVHVDDDTNFANGTLTTKTTVGWNGVSLAVDITDHTVNFGTTKYIWIIYDIAFGAGPVGETIRSRVTNIAVSGDDIGASGGMYSNPITIQKTGDIDTISYCSDCHNMPILDGSRSASATRGGSRAVGNHASVTAHVPPSPTAANCVSCHGTEVTDLNHRNGIINMATTINGGSYSKGSSFVQNASGTMGTCDNTWCHGIDSDPWGMDDSAYYTCTKCHGTKTLLTEDLEDWQMAPGNGGVDTAGDTASDDPQVGAHYQHLAGPANIAGAVASHCYTCHLEPENVFDAEHVDSGAPAEMTYNDFVKNYGGLTPKRTDNTCENTYCHGAKMPYGSTDGAQNKPSWLDTTYLSEDDNADHDCAQCHGFPPKGYAGGEHEGMEDFKAKTGACHICHQILKDPENDTEDGWIGGAFNDKERHIDGVLDVAAACDGCHGYPPTSGDGHSYYDVEGKGVHLSHVVHLEKLYGLTMDAQVDLFDDAKVEILCMACHFGSTHEQTQQDTLNNLRTIGFNATIYKFGTAAAKYNGFQNTPGETTPKTCSNNSCHYITSPQWEQWP